MRLAVLIVGMLVAIWIYIDVLQLIRIGNPEVSDLGGGGVLSALWCAVAAILVFPRPLGATMLFGLAALTSFVVATQGDADHYLHGSTMVTLAVMSLLGGIAARRARQQAWAERTPQRAHGAPMANPLYQQQQA